MAGSDAMTLPTQRLVTVEELVPILDGIGTPVATTMLSGGTFSAVQSVDLADSRRVVAKVAVPEGALPDGRTPLLTYEHNMLRSEHDMLRLVAAMKEVRGRRFGYPARDFALGVDTWPEFVNRLFATVVADAKAWGVDIEAERVLAALDRAQDALAEVTEPLMVHNDLWFGNVLLTPETGEVHGVVDFERTLFGDPLWDFVGADSHSTGPAPASLLEGYESAGRALPRDRDAGTVSGFTPAADLRSSVYRLWAMSVQFIEIVPRGFRGEWLTAHRESIISTRRAVFERVGV